MAAAAAWEIAVIAHMTAERNMRQQTKKKVRNHILMVVGQLLAFLVIPWYLLSLDFTLTEKFGAEQFVIFILWPSAGVILSALYALAVKNEKIWLVIPGLTVCCLLLVHVLHPEISLLLSMICLIFEVMGYGMIYFWRKI